MRNRLAAESSPYLRQHADNPVDWWPWCEEALTLAAREDRPILLSIGYSACHWCHVMAQESFQDPATAEIMNTLFVNIKVDREERPDLDRIHQLAHQALSQRGGGWPLTVFLSPDDRVPFFAGTYFPPTPRHGLPGFADLLRRLRAWYDRNRAEVRAQNLAMRQFLDEAFAVAEPDPATALADLDDVPIDRAVTALERNFDPAWGGFGSAPKFPHAGDLELLLDVAEAATGPEHDRLARIALHSLRRMAEGGIHDQLGGGFCRYSVDARWEIPHFEKMLYDNALLLPLYARAAADTGEPLFRNAAEGIAAWLEREMRAEDGGHFAALDADSDDGHGHHEEGAFYLWTREQVREVLSEADYPLAAARYGFERAANFEGRAWNPVLARDANALVAEFGPSPEAVEARCEEIRRRLFDARARRPRPGLDDKRLTAWNALLASGYARAAARLRRPDWGRRATAILRFLHENVWRQGRLHASHQGGQARFPAYLDDHAFLIDALLDALALPPAARDLDDRGGEDGDPGEHWLNWASELADLLLRRFEDRERGGFYFTADDHESLIVRPRSFTDEALPNGNAIAARALSRLGHLGAEQRWLDAAERTLSAAAPSLRQAPQACAATVSALREYLRPPLQVVLRLPAGQAAETWLPAIGDLGARGVRLCLLAADSPSLPVYPGAPGGLAHVCVGTRCLAPAHDPETLLSRCREIH